MKFTKFIALIAITGLAINASAYQDGTLRRVAQNDEPTTGVVILNSNSNLNTSESTSRAEGTSKAVAQPVTVVEASPVSESRAEALRKARVNEEVSTEQKIVEKLEDSRLQEEKARADRLFGNKLDPQPVQQQQQAVIVAPAPAPAPAPVVEQKPVQATTVTIEKVEIIQPKEEAKVEKAEVVESKMEAPAVEKVEAAPSRYFVSGQVGNLSYQASNIKSNYGLGVAIGTIIDDRWAVELAYFYSNHTVDTFWQEGLYRQLDQNDISASGKYYVFPGKFRPYVGGSITYIDRKYTDRVKDSYAWFYNPSTTEANTQAVDMGVLAGADFFLSNNLIIGGGIDYNFNVMNNNPIKFDEYTNQPANTKELETIGYYSVKVNAKFMF